jgi:hypothetical protein
MMPGGVSTKRSYSMKPKEPVDPDMVETWLETAATLAYADWKKWQPMKQSYASYELMDVIAEFVAADALADGTNAASFIRRLQGAVGQLEWHAWSAYQERLEGMVK